jgi:glycosyltransferase involved in cell wall biosynthesis/predicted metal-dependent phosphoesterase TrpH
MEAEPGIEIRRERRRMSPTTRADLHVHSTASQMSRLGVQTALGLPECATPPHEVYALAKRRGMDFVTITDHDTIQGALQLADRPDVFISEELTADFAGEPQQVHILCYGITPDDHARLHELAGDVEAVAEYLHDREIACALAHPFYAVSAPLAPRHRRRLAQLFPVWEVRNGSRAPELNLPAAIYIDTHGGTGIGGTDDHAGIDIGRTWTEAPAAGTPAEFLEHVRAGRVETHGEQGSAAKWAHAAMALTVRALGRGESSAPPDPMAVLKMAERVVSQGDARCGTIGGDLGPDDSRALLRAWLDSIGLGLTDAELLAWLQSDGFSHGDLQRRARRWHERKLQSAVAHVLASAGAGEGWGAALVALFDACVPVVPYASSTAFLGREKHKLTGRESEPVRVALVADGVGGMHGVTHTLDEIRERGVAGFDVEVIGTDMKVDRRLSAVAEVEIPFYAGLMVGVPSPLAVVEALAEGRYGLVHVCAPGPAGLAAALAARILDLPLAGAYHTELATYAGLRSGDRALELGVQAALGAFYEGCDVVLSPSAASDARLAELGVAAERIGRWDRGVDIERFDPRKRNPNRFGGPPERVHVLYAGRQTLEKGVDVLADSFLAARERDPRLHLVLAGGGPEEGRLRERLGDAATFLGWLDGEALAVTYASADLLLFCSQTDTFGQVLLEAQASGLPVVAVAAGGPRELIESGRSGLLCPPDPAAIGAAVAELASADDARARLARGGLAAVRERSWDAALARLADGWRRGLAHRSTESGLQAA